GGRAEGQGRGGAVRDPDHPPAVATPGRGGRLRSEEHTSELQSRGHLVCRLLLEKKNGARVFSILNSTVVVAQGSIHFHHFWYGVGMIMLAGWLGIAFNRPRLVRTYAIIFGLGAGLIGDDGGLLLTFGDYLSSLTTDFFVGV